MRATTDNTPPAILVVDDNPMILQLVERTLRVAGHRCITACDGEGALELARSCEFRVALLDIELPGLSGTDLARRLLARSPAPVVILMSGLFGAGGALAEVDIPEGVSACLAKPFQPAELTGQLEAALERQRSEIGA